MDIRILGPVEVWDEGRQLHLPRRQQRLIMGFLALEPNAGIPCGRLVELLWGDQPPDRALAIVQSRISEVRAARRAHRPAADASWLAHHGSGYVLRVEPAAVDVHRFRSAVSAAGTAMSHLEARDLLRGALALWRGPLFGASPAHTAQAALFEAMESARLTAAEDLFAAELRLGRHREVLDELRVLATQHPGRDRLVAQKLLALHRCGHTVDGLRYFDRWRRWLADELGIDPGPQARQAHLELLRSDTTAGAQPTTLGSVGAHSAPRREPESWDPPSAPRLLPPAVPDFSGREREIDFLRSRLHPGTPSPVVAVYGPGGVGKTTLCVHVAHLLRDRFPDGQLYVDLRGAHRDRPLAPTEVLGRFLRALDRRNPALPDALDDRMDLYRDRIAGRRILVVLDNAAAESQVLPLIPGSEDARVVITSRRPVGAALGIPLLRLTALDPPAAATLLASIAGGDRLAAEPHGMAQLCRRCGYLPLAIRIVGAKLTAKPHLIAGHLDALLDDARRRLDHLALGHLDVRATVALSYAELSTAARRLLCRIGDADVPDVPVWTAAALLDTDLDSAEATLEQLVDAQLLDAAGTCPAGRPRYRVHDLVRLFARERAASEESTDRLAAARKRLTGACLAVADAVARQVSGGGLTSLRGSAPRWTVAGGTAGQVTTPSLSWLEAEQPALHALFERATADGLDEECWNLAMAVAPLVEARRYGGDWQGLLQRALALSRRQGNLRGEAVVLCLLAHAWSDREDMPQRTLASYRRAATLFRKVGDRHGRALAVAGLAHEYRMMGADEAALRRYAAALPALRAAGDHAAVARALRGIAQVHVTRDAHQEAERRFAEALEISRRHRVPRVEAQVLLWQSRLHMIQGHLSVATQETTTALAISRRFGDGMGEVFCLAGLGLCHHLQGDDARARALLEQVEQLVGQARPHVVERAGQASVEELRDALARGRRQPVPGTAPR